MFFRSRHDFSFFHSTLFLNSVYTPPSFFSSSLFFLSTAAGAFTRKGMREGGGKERKKEKKRTASKLDLGGLSRFRGSFSPSLSLFYLSSLPPPPPPLLLLPGYFIFIYLVPRGGNFLDCDDAGRKEIDR